MPDYHDSGTHLVPMFDSPDRQRFAFWRPHATPIQASLLRLSGWLEDEVPREVLVARGDGTLVAHDAGGSAIRATLTTQTSPADHVLFRLEKPGTRERADWEGYFLAVRKLQAHGRLVHQKISETERELTRIDMEILALHESKAVSALVAEQEQAEFGRKVSDLEQRARKSLAKGSKPAPNGPYRKLEAMQEEGRALSAKWAEERRAIASRFEALKQERVPVQQRKDWLSLRSDRHVFAGLFTVVNAFLDVQALSAASMAIEEFRKNPRNQSAIAEEMEARLATD